jgi:hypothetical protein
MRMSPEWRRCAPLSFVAPAKPIRSRFRERRTE